MGESYRWIDYSSLLITRGGNMHIFFANYAPKFGQFCARIHEIMRLILNIFCQFCTNYGKFCRKMAIIPNMRRNCMDLTGKHKIGSNFIKMAPTFKIPARALLVIIQVTDYKTYLCRPHDKFSRTLQG